MIPAKERVQKGCMLLDKYYPGWHEKVDCDMMYVEDSFHCIIAYVKGLPYHRSIRGILGKEHPEILKEMSFCSQKVTDKAKEYGFYPLEDTIEYSRVLNVAWKSEIYLRQAQGV